MLPVTARTSVKADELVVTTVPLSGADCVMVSPVTVNV